VFESYAEAGSKLSASGPHYAQPSPNGNEFQGFRLTSDTAVLFIEDSAAGLEPFAYTFSSRNLGRVRLDYFSSFSVFFSFFFSFFFKRLAHMRGLFFFSSFLLHFHAK
jgi:hypothetical protein